MFFACTMMFSFELQLLCQHQFCTIDYPSKEKVSDKWSDPMLIITNPLAPAVQNLSLSMKKHTTSPDNVFCSLWNFTIQASIICTAPSTVFLVPTAAHYALTIQWLVYSKVQNSFLIPLKVLSSLLHKFSHKPGLNFSFSVSVTVIKYHDQSLLGEKRVYLSVQLSCHTASLREARTWTKGRNLDVWTTVEHIEEPWFLSWFPGIPQFSSIYITGPYPQQCQWPLWAGSPHQSLRRTIF